MTGLVSVIQQPSLPFIPLNVSDVLLTLHRPDNIELWDPHDTLAAFWEISNQVSSCTSPSDIQCICVYATVEPLHVTFGAGSSVEVALL